MSFFKRAGNFAMGVAKSEGKRLARRGLQALSDKYLGGCVSGMGVRRRRKSKGGSRLVKGSAAAKAHMSKLRAMRTRKGCYRGCRRAFKK